MGCKTKAIYGNDEGEAERMGTKEAEVFKTGKAVSFLVLLVFGPHGERQVSVMKTEWANKQTEYNVAVEENVTLKDRVNALEKENESLQVLMLQVSSSISGFESISLLIPLSLLRTREMMQPL